MNNKKRGTLFDAVGIILIILIVFLLTKLTSAPKHFSRPVSSDSHLISQTALKTQLQDKIGHRKVDLEVYDTKTHQKASYQNGGHKFWLASSIKLAILAQLITQKGPLGGFLDQQAQLMIEQSDNQAASNLFQQIGGNPGLQSFLDRLHMSKTHLNPNGFGLSTSTATDQVKLLNYIQKMPPANQNYLFNLCHQIVPDQRFGLGQTQDTLFKNGWLNNQQNRWYVNSIGIINHRYSVVILTQNNPSFPAGKKLVNQIATTLVDHHLI